MIGHRLLALLLSQIALAHPLDECQHLARITLSAREIRVDYQVVFGGLLAPGEWSAADTDRDRRLSAAEREQWVAGLRGGLTLELEGQELPLEPVNSTLPDYEPFVSGTGPLVTLTLAAAVELQPERDYRLHFAYRPYRRYRSRYQTTVVAPKGAAVFDLKERPTSLTLTFCLSGEGGGAGGQQPKGEGPRERRRSGVRGQGSGVRGQESRFQRWLNQGLPLGWLIPTLLVGGFVFGALHALQPGHGKALVAAYLVGSHGTIREAVFLGMVVTATHTASVFLLGLLAWGGRAFWRPDQVSAWLTLASGLLITAVGAWFFLRARRARGHPHPHDPQAHSHEQDHDHHHGHDHPHPWAVSQGSLLSLGVGGGLVPCVDAVMAMLYAILVRRIGLGFLFVTAFSLGLAGVLTLTGILIVTGRDRLARWASESRIFKALPLLSAALITLLGLLLTLQGLVQTGIVTIPR